MAGNADKFQLDSTYFVRVHPVITILVILFPWVLFPVMVFTPTWLSTMASDYIVETLVLHHSNLVKLFNIHLWIHAIESIVAIQKCRRYGINANTTLMWTASVALHGIFALKFLLWPAKEAKRILTH